MRRMFMATKCVLGLYLSGCCPQPSKNILIQNESEYHVDIICTYSGFYNNSTFAGVPPGESVRCTKNNDLAPEEVAVAISPGQGTSTSYSTTPECCYDVSENSTDYCRDRFSCSTLSVVGGTEFVRKDEMICEDGYDTTNNESLIESNPQFNEDSSSLEMMQE